MKKNMKRWISALMVLCICIGLVPVFAVEAEAVSAGDGTFIWPVSTSISLTNRYNASSHPALDFGCGIGTEVSAIASGTVIVATDYGCQGSHLADSKNCTYGDNCPAVQALGGSGSYANWIIIDHGNGFYSLYAHLSTGTFRVSVGDPVSQGQVIAKSGNAGKTKGTTGAHLHLELRSGANKYANGVNPELYLTKTNTASGGSGGNTGMNPHTLDGTYAPYLPIHAYPISTGRITVYDPNGTAYNSNERFIDGSTDKCILQEIYTDGWCQVKYPSSAEPSGYFTAYVKLDVFISGAAPTPWTASAAGDAYRRSTGSDTIGSVSKGDTGLKVASANGRTQVVYPVSGAGYHKMGWIDGNSGSGNSGSSGGSNVGTATGYLLPCYSYPISTGRITVYDANRSPHANRWIDGASDQCIIREIYSDGWCYISYPSSAEADGYFEAYVPLSTFISNPNPVTWVAPTGGNAYRRSTGAETIGSVDAGDGCVKVSEGNGRIQIMYPVTGTSHYKMGWLDAATSYDPQGCYDDASAGLYSVYVRGWAFDRDDLNAALEIHVYVGGRHVKTLTANTGRPDVDDVFGCGDYHGFESHFEVPHDLTGNQEVQVYALNIHGGNNTCLGTRVVNIASDASAPVISNVTVTDVTSTGYTITCTVTDDNGVDRVQFPTWTVNNDQDDIFANWSTNTAASGTRNGNTYTYRVHTSAHNYEGGRYLTHIYAFDKFGNQTCYDALPEIVVPIEVQAVTLSSSQLTFTGIGDTQTLTAAVYPTTATDKSVTWTSSDTSVATVSGGVVKAVGYGTAVITAASANGITDVCTVTVKERPAGALTVGSGSGTPGETVAVAIRLDSNPGLIAARLKVSYDANALTLTGVQDGGILGEYVFGNDLTANPYILMWENGLAASNYTATGNLITLTFRIKENAQPGSYGISVAYDQEEVYNIGLENVSLAVTNGTVTVEEAAQPTVGSCGANVRWSLEDGTLTISGTGAMKHYTYKSEMPWYDYMDQITGVVIEEGVTSIGDYAFYGMGITWVEIPETVTAIGDYAFKNCAKLNHVKLPSNLTKLGESAFYACTSLTSVEIPAKLYTVKPYTFKNCTALAEVTFHEGNLQKISDGAFYNTAITQLVLPDCLSILDVYSFKNCSKLASITIGSGLTEIREAVFYGTAITEITIPEGVTKISPYAFKNCTRLENVELPESLTSIGEASFYANTALKALNLPDAVTKIGNYAFRKCAALETVHFGANLVNIGESSFYGCENLMVLEIPHKVTTIQAYAFKGCVNLEIVNLPESLTTLGDSAFHTCTGLSEITIPAKVSKIGEYCFSGSCNLYRIVFTGDAPAIGAGAFNKIAATAYYPGSNTTWTAEAMQNYGGTITWKAN